MILFITFIIVYFAFELSYLSFTLPIYSKNLKAVQGKHWPANVTYTILAYLIIIMVLWYFLIRGIRQKKLEALCLDATMLAIAIFGVYNFTNLATLKNYDPSVALLDILWGIFSLNAVCIIVHFIHG